MRKSSKNQGYRWSGNPPGVHRMFSPAQACVRQERDSRHYDPSGTALPSIGRGRDATSCELLTISRGRHGSAILLTDQRDGSEKVCRLVLPMRPKGDPLNQGAVAAEARGATRGIVR